MSNNVFFDNLGPFCLKDILEVSGLSVVGDYNPNDLIYGVGALKKAKSNELSFFLNVQYKDDFFSTKAGYCITRTSYAKYANNTTLLLVSENPSKSYASVLSMFYKNKAIVKKKVAENAAIAESAKIGKDVTICNNVVIEENVVIGEGSYIGDNTVISHDVQIGSNVEIANNVSISHAIIGNDVVIHSGVRIGQAGFGFASDKKGHYKIMQLGIVRIGNNVDIGANSCIDRGSSDDTEIGDHTNIDNLVQIGHNVKIGFGCVIVSQVGIAGSTHIGNGVLVGGQAGVSGHLKIDDFAQIAAKSGVINNISTKTKVAGYPAIPVKQWHRQSLYLKKLISRKNDHE